MVNNDVTLVPELFSGMSNLILLPPWQFTIICILSFASFAFIGMFFARMYFSNYVIEKQDNATANIFIRLIGTLLTVMLAFVVISVWQDYEEQRKRTVLEACILGNLYRDSRGLDPETENMIQEKIRIYTSDLVNNSWPALKRQEESKSSWMSFNYLYGAVIRLSPKDQGQGIVMLRMVGHMNDLASYRRMRLLRNINPVIPPILWGTIICGSIVTIMFSLLFNLKNKKLQNIMILSLCTMYGLIFSFIILMNYPYRSSIQISPQPIEHLLTDVFPTSEITEVLPTED